MPLIQNGDGGFMVAIKKKKTSVLERALFFWGDVFVLLPERKKNGNSMCSRGNTGVQEEILEFTRGAEVCTATHENPKRLMISICVDIVSSLEYISNMSFRVT
jgi:hypothetical protein